jgi:hypothetical protein
VYRLLPCTHLLLESPLVLPTEVPSVPCGRPFRFTFIFILRDTSIRSDLTIGSADARTGEEASAEADVCEDDDECEASEEFEPPVVASVTGRELERTAAPSLSNRHELERSDDEDASPASGDDPNLDDLESLSEPLRKLWSLFTLSNEID